MRPERSNTADAFGTADNIIDVGSDIVADVGLIQRPVRRIERRDEQISGASLADRNALALDVSWKERRREREFVLNLNLGNVRVCARLESQGDAAGPVRAGRRGDIIQPVEAGELLLDDLRDGIFHCLGRGTGIAGVDADRWRRNVRVLRNGQTAKREGADEHDDDRNHPGKDGAINEESGHQGLPVPIGFRRGRPHWQVSLRRFHWPEP